MLTTWNICQVLPILKTENPKWFSLFCRGNNKRPNMIEQMLVDFPFKFQTSAYFLPLFLHESFVLPPLWSSFLRAVTDIRGNFFPKRVPILLKTRETDTHWIPLSSSTLQSISFFLFSNAFGMTGHYIIIKYANLCWCVRR